MKISQSQEDSETHKLLKDLVSRMDLIDDIIQVEDFLDGVRDNGFIRMGYMGRKPVNRFIDFKVVLDRWENDGRIQFLSREGPFPTWSFRFDRGLCGLAEIGSAQGGPLPQIDSLTSLYTRESFDRDLKALVVAANPPEIPLSLAMIDIDFFKKFNDEHGHQAGDLILEEIGRTIKTVASRKARAYRYGGEEMGVLMPNFGAEEAIAASERIRQAIQVKSVVFKGEELSVTISVGVAEYALGESSEGFVGRADQALYQAKHDGRNCVCRS